jgi:hypothetical protein
MPVLRADAALKPLRRRVRATSRPDLNDPPTAVGGIVGDGSGLLRW